MSRPIFIAYIAAITAAFVVAMLTLLPAPAISAETPNRMDEAAIAYWDDRDGATNPALAAASFLGEVFWPGYERRETHVHIHKFCEAQFSPPEGWLRDNGYCPLTDQTSKGSLIYSGEDYWFGFKPPSGGHRMLN